MKIKNMKEILQLFAGLMKFVNGLLFARNRWKVIWAPGCTVVHAQNAATENGNYLFRSVILRSLVHNHSYSH